MLPASALISTSTARHIRRTALGLACIIASTFGAEHSALAQDLSAQNISSEKPQSDSISLNLAADTMNFNSFSAQNSTDLIELPVESVGSTLFKLDLSNTNCLTGNDICLRRNDNLDLGYSTRIASVSPTGIDLTLTPRAVLRRSDDSSSAALGAVFEIGEDLRKGAGIDSNTWYIFAGADAEAVSYSSHANEALMRGQYYLQDSIIVGDAHAGFGYRMGDADLSLSYNRREASSDEYSFKEDAAALSFTWKR